MLTFIIQQIIKNKITSQRHLETLKRQAAFRFKKPLANNIAILKAYRQLLKKSEIIENISIEKLLKTREVRTLSGVAIITVLTKPYPCPGHCLYCPTEKDMPKSYLANEPAAMRAVLNKFNPYKQVKMRLEALNDEGHQTDKIELIILGGTWSAHPQKYQEWFIKRCFEACNLSMGSAKCGTSSTLKNAQRINEKTKHRIVGLTLETRPDYIDLAEIKRLRQLGCTRVELGVQSIYDDILKINKRGHNVTAIIQATKLLKNAGFKINYHMMLNLPGSSLERDEKTFDELFTNPVFQPDLLKIYPCAVIKTAPLYKLWQKNKYPSYSDKELMTLLIKIKQKIPAYVRIQRIIRDIPKESIIAGSKISNLRQIISQQPDKKCLCIRCREVKNNNLSANIKLFRHDYNASDGREIFLSFEDDKRKNLYALLRLRIPSSYFSKEKATLKELNNAALIREIHTYGEMVCLNDKNKNPQHRGLGKKLIAEAEKITENEFHLKKIAVISGIGVRSYYKKLRYKLKNTYMIKQI